MNITVSTALMLVSGQITAEMRNSINSKDRRIREDVEHQHMLSEYFSTVNAIDDLLKDRKSESYEVKYLTFSKCCEIVIAELIQMFDKAYDKYVANKYVDRYLARVYLNETSRINELEHLMLEIEDELSKGGK